VWQTPAEVEDLASYIAQFGGSLGKPGTGGPLKLTPATSLAAAPPQTDPRQEANWGDVAVAVTGTQGADFAAVGDTVTGQAGDTVTAAVGVRNRGPATIDRGGAGDPVAFIDVAIPPGATVVNVPAAADRRSTARSTGTNPSPLASAPTCASAATS
jgi:hypothetical protein